MFGSTKLELTFDSYNCKQAFLGLSSDEISALKMIAVDEAFSRKKTPPILSAINKINVETGEILSGPFAGDATAYEYKDGRCYIHVKLTDAELEHFSEMVYDRKPKLYPRLQAHIYPVKFKEGEPHTIKIQIFKIVYGDEQNIKFKFDDIDDDPVEEEPKQKDDTTLMNIQLFGYNRNGRKYEWPKEVVEKAFKDAFDNGPVLCTITKDPDLYVPPDMLSVFGKVISYHNDEVYGDRIKGTVEFYDTNLGRFFRYLIDDNTLCLSPRFVGNINEYGDIENLKIISFNPIPAAQFKNQFRKEEDSNE